jgi:hypothetical protein
MPRAVIRKPERMLGSPAEDPLCDRTCGFYRKLCLRQNHRS